MCRAAWTCRRSTAPHRRRVRWSCLHQDRSAAAAEAAAQLASRPARVNLMLLPNGTCWRHLRTLRMHLHAPRMHPFDFLPVRTITATGPVRQTPWSHSLRSPTTLPTPVLQPSADARARFRHGRPSARDSVSDAPRRALSGKVWVHGVPAKPSATVACRACASFCLSGGQLRSLGVRASVAACRIRLDEQTRLE